MTDNTHTEPGSLQSCMLMIRAINAEGHLALTPEQASRTLLSRQAGDQSEYGRLIKSAVHCLGDIVEHATRLTNSLFVDGLTQPIRLDEEAVEQAVVTGLERTHRLFTGDMHAHARGLDEVFGTTGHAPTERHGDGLLLLSSARLLPNSRKLDFWDTLELAVITSVATAIIEQAPPIATLSGTESTQLSNDLAIPAVTSKVDWKQVELRLLRWRHLLRHGQNLPLPFSFDELAGGLLSGDCPPSLCRQIHDLCLAQLRGDNDTLLPAHLFPEHVADLLMTATAALGSWDLLQDYHRYWMCNDEGYLQALFHAIKGSLLTLDKGFGKGGVGLRLETFQNQSRFQELRKLIHAASVQDDSPIEEWSERMPAWARSVVLYGANLAVVRKRPAGGATQAGRPPAEIDTGYFTIKEAAGKANVSTSTIRRWLSDGTIPKPARLPTSGDSSKWQIVFTEQEVDDLKLLAMSSDELADQLGVTDRSVRRRMTKLRKNNPGFGRLDLLKLLLGMDTGRGSDSRSSRGGKR